MRRAILTLICAASVAIIPALHGANPPAATPAGATEDRPTWQVDCELPGKPADDWRQECMRRAAFNAGSKGEPWIAVNPRNPRNIVVGMKDIDPSISNGCVWMTLSVTHDAGKTWRQVIPGGRFQDRTPNEFAYQWSCATDPMFRFASDGTLYLAMELYALAASVTAAGSVGTKQLLMTSTDGGLTFARTIQVLQLESAILTPDHPMMAISPTTGTILIAYVDYLAGARCYIVSSRDGGRSEDPVVSFSTLAQSSRGCFDLAVSSDGRFTALITSELPHEADPEDRTRRAFFVTSADDGRTWSEPQAAFEYDVPPLRYPESEHRPGFSFEITYDPSGRLHALYEDFSQGHGDLLFRTSFDHGRTWGPARRIDADASNHHRFLGGIEASDDGSLHAVYLDKRYDPGNRLIDTMYAHSTDAGRTWTEERVSTVSYDGDRARHQDGYAWLGDYTGISAARGKVWMAVPDASSTEFATVAVARASRA